MHRISMIEGIGPTYQRRLDGSGIHTTEDLLTMCKKRSSRHHLADDTGISEKMILRWTNHADLFRIKGVGEEYADLLEAAGIDTVPELARRNPEHLYEALRLVNEDKRLVKKIPSQNQIHHWVLEAKVLPRMITY
jgi:predicted flap endonuclease-1-like 5' DNA nuclease